MKPTVSLLLILLVSAVSGDAKAPRSTSSSTSSKKPAVAKPYVVKGGKSPSRKAKSGKRTVQQTKRAPRQLEPTAERYTQIQQALADKGYYTGEVNGAWGADSVEALKRFQQAQNLSPDGKLGSLSLIALGLGPSREPLAQFQAKPESNR